MQSFRAIMILTGVAIIVTGCASAPNKMQKLDIGMTKSEALKVMGTPDRTAANEQAEAFYYSHQPFGQWVADWYYVNIVQGKVESFGQMQRSQSDLDQQRAAAAYMLGHMSVPQAQPAIQPSAYQMPVNRPINCTTNHMGSTAYTNCN